MGRETGDRRVGLPPTNQGDGEYHRDIEQGRVVGLCRVP